MCTTIVRQIWMPLTHTVSQEEPVFAATMPRKMEQWKAKDEALKAAIIKAEGEIEDLFSDSYSLICDHAINTRDGQFVWMLFVRREKDHE